MTIFAITAEGVRKPLDKTDVLKGVGLRVLRGEIFALLGVMAHTLAKEASTRF